MQHLGSLRAALSIASFVLLGFPLAAVGPVFEPRVGGRPTLEFAEPRIFDLTENYDDTAAGIALKYTLVQDPSGKLTGFGTGEAALFGIDISLQFRIDGTVKGPGNVTPGPVQDDGRRRGHERHPDGRVHPLRASQDRDHFTPTRLLRLAQCNQRKP